MGALKYLWCSLVMVTAFADSISAQRTSAASIQVDVQPVASFLAGNVTRIAYVVANTPQSADRLFEFTVRSPVPIWRLEVPTPRAVHGVTREGNDNVASWGWFEDMPRPGERTPVLAYEAIGLPGIVAYRALRYYGVRSDDHVRGDHTVGKTVGVDTLPTDLRPSALAQRLRRLVDEACHLGWIASPGSCRTLRANTKPTRHVIRAFLRELVTRRGTDVSEPAFALLAPNAEFLLSRL